MPCEMCDVRFVPYILLLHISIQMCYVTPIILGVLLSLFTYFKQSGSSQTCFITPRISGENKQTYC